MISAGRVLIRPKGDYDPNTTYEMLDYVSYNGSSYIAKGTTTGNLPTNTTYWQLSAYGGQASNIAGDFAPLETTDYASRAYAIDEIFVDKDSQLVIATDAINIGDEIEIGSNCEITSIADLLDDIKDHYDALDQRNRKLIGVTQLTAQTDLHLLVPGEYFKKLTNFYVTNGPTGVNQVPTAVFRLTVESGLDESSSSILLTLRASDGKVYTQSYDGTSWSAWVEVASKAYVDSEIASLGSASTKDSTNAVTEGSTDLVESGAVYTEIQALSGQIALKASQTDLDNVSQKVSNSGDTYSSSKAYKVGDLVIHDNVLYRCITACSAAAWSVNQSCFTADTLSNAVTSLNTQLTVSERNIAGYGAFNGITLKIIKMGALCVLSFDCNIPRYPTRDDIYNGMNFSIGILPQDCIPSSISQNRGTIVQYGTPIGDFQLVARNEGVLTAVMSTTPPAYQSNYRLAGMLVWLLE